MAGLRPRRAGELLLLARHRAGVPICPSAPTRSPPLAFPRAVRHVTLITGPSCGGKSTLAQRLAQPGDVILDLDVIAQRLDSPTRWRHDPDLVTQAEECMTQALRRLARTEHVTAYIIRCAPHPAQRAQLARAIKADVVYVLRPPMAEVLARARRDGRPKGTATTIRQWYRRYAPSEVDSPCPPEHPAPAPTQDAAASPASAPSTTPCTQHAGSRGNDQVGRAQHSAATAAHGAPLWPRPSGHNAPPTARCSASTAASPRSRAKPRTTRSRGITSSGLR